MRKRVVMMVVLLLMVRPGSTGSLSQGAGDAQQHEGGHARFPASRGATLPGDLWLTWLFPVRVWFVESAVSGYRTGSDDGCTDARATMGRLQAGALRAAEDLCPNRREYDNKAILYAEQITEFYARYPGDRDLPLAYLIRMLLGRKPKTLDEIHRWVGSVGQ